MHYTSLVACIMAVSTAALASPVEVRQTKCHPNFEGVGVSVVWDQYPFAPREWVPGEAGANITTTLNDLQAAPEFRFEQTSSPVTSYIAKKLNVPGNNMIAGVGNDNKYVNMEYMSSTEPYQTWDVSCDVCGTNAWNVHGLFANGCTIKSVGLGLCAQVVTTVPRAHSAPSFLLELVACNGAPNQNFQFWMV